LILNFQIKEKTLYKGRKINSMNSNSFSVNGKSEPKLSDYTWVTGVDDQERYVG
jgi:hypothetical protein